MHKNQQETKEKKKKKSRKYEQRNEAKLVNIKRKQIQSH